MYITKASFEIDKAQEDRLINKAKKNEKEIKAAKGNISFECWRKEHKDTVEYVMVSKWESDTDFKAWISREEHVQEHKAMHKARKENGGEQVKVKKVLESFELFETKS